MRLLNSNTVFNYCFIPLSPPPSPCSCREFVVQIQSERISKSNPKLLIEADVHGRNVKPTVEVKFVDDSDPMVFETNEMKVEELKGDLFQRLLAIEEEYDAQGKSVD